MTQDAAENVHQKNIRIIADAKISFPKLNNRQKSHSLEEQKRGAIWGIFFFNEDWAFLGGLTS